MTAPIPSRGDCGLVFGFALETAADLRVRLPAVPGPPELRLTVRAVPGLSPPPGPLVFASDPAAGEDAGITVYRTGNTATMQFRGVDQFRIGDHHIECDLLSADLDYLVSIQFLGMVMALWLERRGLPVLHASGVAVDGRGVAFLATKRGGKTSLAAALTHAGHPMLSDDLVTVSVTADGPLARPAYPQLRMEPDVAAHFLDRWETLPIVHPDFEKRRVPVGLIGRFEARPVPLTRIYLPERIDAATGVEITPIPGAEALIELLRESFLPRVVAAFGLEADRLQTLGQLVRVVPVKRLRFPAGFEHLPDVVVAIEDDLGA